MLAVRDCILISLFFCTFSLIRAKPSASKVSNQSSSSKLVPSFPVNANVELINGEQLQGKRNQTLHHTVILEGDIAVDYREDQGKNSSRYAINNNYGLWRSGRIPYVIDGSLAYNGNLIRRAMKHIMSKTCIKFVPRTNERDYVRIYRGPNRACFSRIGRSGGRQMLSLGNGCLFHGVVVHELMHAIGFYHMHSRSDRDNYLTVLWGNIQNGMKSNFYKNNPYQNKIMGPFDFGSIMLYGSKLFSLNGRDTMIARKRGVRLLDTAVKFGLSNLDAQNINQLYGCGGGSRVDKRKTNRSG